MISGCWSYLNREFLPGEEELLFYEVILDGHRRSRIHRLVLRDPELACELVDHVLLDGHDGSDTDWLLAALWTRVKGTHLEPRKGKDYLGLAKWIPGSKE